MRIWLVTVNVGLVLCSVSAQAQPIGRMPSAPVPSLTMPGLSNIQMQIPQPRNQIPGVSGITMPSSTGGWSSSGPVQVYPFVCRLGEARSCQWQSSVLPPSGSSCSCTDENGTQFSGTVE